MTNKNVRVRFAPSPTGGLHLGGVRTVLYNYLYSQQHGGKFVLRIEDTDQTRYVAGAEDYIYDCLNWCQLPPDESPKAGGPYAPYRQSERKPLYKQYAEQLVAQGNAYYAFDTPDELNTMREAYKTAENPSPTYGHATRMHMKNSIALGAEKTAELLAANTPYVIRILIPAHEQVSFTDTIRGLVSFDTNQVDDKVLLKADGMPTYHLAVVVDDYLMHISHAFRGEEWLSSAPVHLLLWQYLGWQNSMPEWSHLPLILGNDGAKLSKRHGNKYGFPIFAMTWNDQAKNETNEGFKEIGFLPQAFVNLLAMMGWNDGTNQEIFSLEELIAKFSLDRVHSAGAQFDYEKAKWYNQEWIKRLSGTELVPYVQPFLMAANINANDTTKLAQLIDLVKERCVLLPDFVEQLKYFYAAPTEVDYSSVLPKWNEQKQAFFTAFAQYLPTAPEANAAHWEAAFKTMATEAGIKPGELMLPLRLMLVGGKFGPGVFDIATQLGVQETIGRINSALSALG